MATATQLDAFWCLSQTLMFGIRHVTDKMSHGQDDFSAVKHEVRRLSENITSLHETIVSLRRSIVSLQEKNVTQDLRLQQVITNSRSGNGSFLGKQNTLEVISNSAMHIVFDGFAGETNQPRCHILY